MKVRVTALGAAALGCSLLAACGGSSGGGTPTSTAVTSAASQAPSTVSRTATVTATPSRVVSHSSSGSSGGSRGSGGGSRLADCAERQLRASIDPRGVPGGNSKTNRAIIVDFENTSNSTCLLHGYPGAALENSGNHQVKQARRTIRGPLLGRPPGVNGEPDVTLHPGDYAAAGIEGTNQQEQGAAQAGCDATYPRILVTPPNTRTAVPFRLKWPVCYGFDIHPVNIENDPPS